jgi:hypothetical protein
LEVALREEMKEQRTTAMTLLGRWWDRQRLSIPLRAK